MGYVVVTDELWFYVVVLDGLLSFRKIGLWLFEDFLQLMLVRV